MNLFEKNNILVCRNVSKSFKDKKVLDNISLNIKENSILGLIGSSGAGKTSLMRTLIGHYVPDSGSIEIDGKSNLKNSEQKKFFGFCVQENSFYLELSLMDNMHYFGNLYGLSKLEIESRSEDLLKLMDLWEFKDYKSENLSGGMKKRFDLALSILHNPKILILDEPTSGLDTLLRRKIWFIIKMIQSRGVTIVLSSHLLDEIEFLCDTVCILKDGKVHGIGSPSELRNNFANYHEVYLESKPGNYRKIKDSLELKKLKIYNFQVEKGIFIFNVQNASNLLQILKNSLEENNETMVSLKIEHPDLSKVLQSILSKK